MDAYPATFVLRHFKVDFYFLVVYFNSFFSFIFLISSIYVSDKTLGDRVLLLHGQLVA